ncbi:UNVERIFIED_CONTAM: hypothetical protein K2H54_010953 [Gekko kuhli]
MLGGRGYSTSECNLGSKRGFSVRSFGTGTHVKLPGPAPDKPNVYDFKTTYDQMYSDLLRKDKELVPSLAQCKDHSLLRAGLWIAPKCDVVPEGSRELPIRKAASSYKSPQLSSEDQSWLDYLSENSASEVPGKAVSSPTVLIGLVDHCKENIEVA